MNIKQNQKLNYEELIYEKSIHVLEEIVSLIKIIKESKIQKNYFNQSKTETKNNISKVEQTTNRLIPVFKWNDYYDYPSINGLRHLIFHEHENGFNQVVRRIGRRVLIKEDEFFKWTERNNNGPR